MKKVFIIAAALACVPTAAAAQDFSGPRIEGRIGWETPTVSDSEDIYKIDSAISFGGEVGFDIQASRTIVVGPYVTYEISNVDACAGTDCIEVDHNLGAGLSLGYVLSPSGMIYAKAGYASLRLTASSGTESVSDDQGGIQGALGFETRLGQGPAYGRLEASYGDYGSIDGIDLNRRHVAAALGVRF